MTDEYEKLKKEAQQRQEWRRHTLDLPKEAENEKKKGKKKLERSQWTFYL